MKLVIEMATDNAAFEGADGGTEAARLLRRCANMLDGGELPEPAKGEQSINIKRLIDGNGNTVGMMSMQRD